MAPIQQFIRWLKDKTGQKFDAKVTRIRQLPPIPSDGSEYGFCQKQTTMKTPHQQPEHRSRQEDSSSHIYEEIIYDTPTTVINEDDDVIQETTSDKASLTTSKFVAGAMQHLDFADAKTVGPYLVVPIRKSNRKLSERHDLDLIADLKNDDAKKTDYQSLYGQIPEWAKDHLKFGARSRQGLDITKSYSVDEPPSDKFLSQATQDNNSHDKSNNESENGTFIVHRAEDELSNFDGKRRTSNGNCRQGRGNIRIQNPSKNKCNKDKNEYTVPSFHPSEDYEYFLIKTQKNLRIEQELRSYLTGTPSDSSPDLPLDGDTRDVLLITKRSQKSPKSKHSAIERSKLENGETSASGRPAKSTKERQILTDRSVVKSTGQSNESKSTRPNERYQRAADALLDQIYSSAPPPGHLRSVVPNGLVPANESAFERRSSFDVVRVTKPITPQKKSSSAASLDDESKFSCRVTNFQLAENKKPRVKTPHPRISAQTANRID